MVELVVLVVQEEELAKVETGLVVGEQQVVDRTVEHMVAVRTAVGGTTVAVHWVAAVRKTVAVYKAVAVHKVAAVH